MSEPADPSPASGRTVTALADGRELIYFDDGQVRPHSARDRRPLAAIRTHSEIRFDPILGEWVIVAAHRQDRTHLPPATQCPLCPSDADTLTEIPDSDYDVAVFENRFPSLTRGATVSPRAGSSPVAGIGRCEVLCYTSDHDASFGNLGRKRLQTVRRALVDRTTALSAMPSVEYVFAFENRGEEIGVTLQHPHGQIYAYPFIPPRIERALASAARHTAETGSCLFCEVIQVESAAGERVVAQTDRFIAFVPAAAHWPFELHIYPRAHIPDVASLGEDGGDELMVMVAEALSRFNGLFSVPPPYILGWMQAPVRDGRDAWHLHVEIASARRSATKLKYLAGSESVVGTFINDVLPEHAAAMLRAPRHRRSREERR